MNERIRELHNLACRIDMEQHPGAIPDGERIQQKFAELIVQECMELASKEQKRYASITHRNMSECAVALGNFSLLMKDHFEDEQ